MELARLTWLQALAIFGAAGGVVVLLHLLRVQRREVIVPFLPLWEELLESRASSRLFARVSSLLSILLSLLIVLLLAFALAEPRLSRAAQARARVVVLDAGLSMQARDEGPSRFAAARAIARGLAAQASDRAPTMIVRLTREATPIAPFSTEPRALLDRLDEVMPSDLPSRVDAGYELALDALAQRGGGELFVLSDRPTPVDAALLVKAEKQGVRVYRKTVGRRSDNVAITAFAARRYPLDRNQSEVLIELTNAADHPERVQLTLLGDGTPLDVRELQLQKGSRELRIYDDLKDRGALLEARIRNLDSRHDDLAADDRAFTALPAHRSRRVLCVTRGNRYLEAALLLDEQLTVDVIESDPGQLASKYDAVIFDGAFPSTPPPAPALYLGPEAPPGMTQTGTLDAPRFERIERAHDLLRHVALQDVNIASGAALQLGAGDKALGSYHGSPLLAVGERTGLPFVLLAFDVRASDLPLRVAFPVLLMNALDLLTGDDAEPPPLHTVGELVELAAPVSTATATSLQLREPGGATRMLSRPRFAPEHAGVYTLEQEGTALVIAVGLRPGSPVDLSPQPAAGPPLPPLEQRRFAVPPWVVLSALVLLLLVLDFFAFHRRLLP